VSRPIVSPVGQSATFVELFFDLVFVFGVTQLVGLLHHDLSWAGAGKTLLVFWLVWWGWTQFTWALNAADTTHPLVELGTLTATAIAFFMAVAVPDAFGPGSLWFAITYVALRLLGLGLYIWVASADPGHRQAVIAFALPSLGGLGAALAGGIAGGTTQVWLWGLTIFLDVVAAVSGARAESWNLHPEHFAERHGLIVIIALGESLIVAASGVVGTDVSAEVLLVAVLAVLVSCGLWWTYFPIAKPELEAALETAEPSKQGALARDAFSLAHFPMLCGVIAYAVGLEEILAHPNEALPQGARLAVALGLLLFVAGTAVAMWRATCGSPLRRVVISGAAALVVYFADGIRPIATLTVVLVGVAVIAFLDESKARRLRTG
jgi:low temperature requirement protein LtrA